MIDFATEKFFYCVDVKDDFGEEVELLKIALDYHMFVIFGRKALKNPLENRSFGDSFLGNGPRTPQRPVVEKE